MNAIVYIAGFAVTLGAIALIRRKKSLKTVGTADEVVRFFKKKGLSNVQAVGIAGNLKEESQFNTQAYGDNGTAYGLAQWRGDRLKALIDFADKKKEDVRDFYTQLEFLWEELHVSEKTALAKLRDSRTVEEATLNFAKYYERPQESTYPKRVQYALDIYNV